MRKRKMDYKVDDILKCIESFSIDRSFELYNVGRIINKNDVYKIVDLGPFSGEKIYIKEIPVNKGVVYAEAIPISIKKLDKYFKCKRIERLCKLRKLKNLS